MNKDNEAPMTFLDHTNTNLMNQISVDIPMIVVRITASGGSNHYNHSKADAPTNDQCGNQPTINCSS
jgi:hypothetical protein